MSPKAKTRACGVIVFFCALVLMVGAGPKLESAALGALSGAGVCLFLLPEALLKRPTMSELQGLMGDFWTRDLKE